MNETNKTCPFCGRSHNEKHVHCTEKCKKDDNARKNKARKLRIKEQRMGFCLYCNEKISVKKLINSKFCSEKCCRKYHSEHRHPKIGINEELICIFDLKSYAKYLINEYAKINSNFENSKLYCKLKQFCEEGKIKDLIKRNHKNTFKVEVLNELREKIIKFSKDFNSETKIYTFEEFLNYKNNERK